MPAVACSRAARVGRSWPRDPTPPVAVPAAAPPFRSRAPRAEAPAAVTARGPQRDAPAYGPELVGAQRDDVDHAQERVGAVERGGGPPDDLDLGHRLERDQLHPQPVAGGGAVRDRAAVD